MTTYIYDSLNDRYRPEDSFQTPEVVGILHPRRMSYMHR